MCGIAGIISLKNGNPVNIDELKKLTLSLSHRGPDDQGVYSEKYFGFGHRRLAIIDCTENSKQPLSYMNNEYLITFNGEIYNFLEIKKKLISKGYQFRTSGDTEIILAAYDYWGTDCQNKFIGMWAFVLFDRKKNIFFFSRDRFGIKPLFYYKTDNFLYFASELKSFNFLSSDLRPSIINNAQTFFENYYEDIADTRLNNVFNLRAGHQALLKNNCSFETKRWWSTKDNLVNISNNLSKDSDHFYYLLKKSIKNCLTSDVNIGCLLSGGLDSSAVSFMRDQILLSDKSENKINHFNFFLKFRDSHPDNIKIQKIRDKLKNFEETNINYDIDFNELIKRIYYLENVSEPAFGYFDIYKFIKSKKIKTVLTGDGPDDYLAGYDYLIHHHLGERNFDNEHIKILDYLFEHNIGSKKNIFFSKLKKLIKSMFLFNQNEYENLYGKHMHIFKEQKLNFNFERTILNSSQSYLNNELYFRTHHGALPIFLRKIDRISMMYGIEARVPFIDESLITFAFSSPDRYKLNYNTKYLLRYSLERNLNIIPTSIIGDRKKQGFTDRSNQYTDFMKKFVLQTIRDHNDFFEIVNFVDKDKTNKLLNGSVKYSGFKILFQLVQYFWIFKTFKEPWKYNKI